MWEFCNNRAKSFKNIWKIKKLVLSLHRFSLIKTSEGRAKVLKYFLKKKFPKNLEVSKISITFAPLFRFRKRGSRKWKF